MIQYAFWSSRRDLSFETHFVFSSKYIRGEKCASQYFRGEKFASKYFRGEKWEEKYVGNQNLENRKLKRKRKQKRKRGSLREGREAPPRRCPHPFRFCFRFRFNYRFFKFWCPKYLDANFPLRNVALTNKCNTAISWDTYCIPRLGVKLWDPRSFCN